MKTLKKSHSFITPKEDSLRLDSRCNSDGLSVMQEIWKDVIGYEGFYQVSNYGRMKSLARTWISGRGKGIKKYHPDLLIKFGSNPQGYCIVQLIKNGVPKAFTVHRIVMNAFIGISILHIDHINGIKNDNQLSNLRYCTNRENQTFNNVRGKENRTSKYHGVGFHKGTNKWRARIFINKKSVWLGLFKTEIEAYNSYQNKLKQISL